MAPIVTRRFEEVFGLSLEPDGETGPREQVGVLTANATA